MKEQIDFNGEIWKPVDGYEGSYEVSNMGRVKSLSRVINKTDGKKQTIKSKILKKTLSGKTKDPKYHSVQMSKNGKSRSFKVHRLVACAFLGERQSGMVVNHKDGDGFNNELNNLEYVTNRENISHGISKKYTGVSYYKKTGKWRASIQIDGKNISLGLHQTEKDASDAYREALNKYSVVNRYAIQSNVTAVIKGGVW